MYMKTGIQDETQYHAEIQVGKITAIGFKSRDVLNAPVDAEDPYGLHQYVQEHHEEEGTQELFLQGRQLRVGDAMNRGGCSSTRHPHVPVEAFLQGDQGLRTFDAADLLELVVQDIAELVDVAGDDLNEHAVIARSVVDADDLGDFLQILRHLVVQGAFFQIDADESGDIVSEKFEVDIEFSAPDDADFLEFFNADMNRSTGYKQLLSKVCVRNARIIHHLMDDLEIQFVKIQFGGHTRFVF